MAVHRPNRQVKDIFPALLCTRAGLTDSVFILPSLSRKTASVHLKVNDGAGGGHAHAVSLISFSRQNCHACITSISYRAPTVLSSVGEQQQHSSGLITPAGSQLPQFKRQTDSVSSSQPGLESRKSYVSSWLFEQSRGIFHAPSKPSIPTHAASKVRTHVF